MLTLVMTTRHFHRFTQFTSPVSTHHSSSTLTILTRHCELFPLCSIPNPSNKIRWSYDLRFQSHTEPWGYYDICEGLKFRSKGMDVEPDFVGMKAVNRPARWQKRYLKDDVSTFNLNCIDLINQIRAQMEHDLN